MVDPAEAIGKARAAVTQRADLPGMSLMEHLDELRKRIVHSALYLAAGFFVAYIFHERLYGFVQAPLNKLGIKLNYTHPMDPLNLYLQVALIGGAILASPFILYQVWLFIAPGLYQKEKRFVVPFMSATVGLFLAGASFGYFFVLPGALKILILGFGSKFNPMVTIEEYTGFFLSIILGLGVSFELPILIFFLALFGIVSPRFLWKNIRYAILAVFLVAAIICPSPDPGTMCIYAVPMLALYVVGIGVAWWVHPSQAKGQRGQGERIVSSNFFCARLRKRLRGAPGLDSRDLGSHVLQQFFSRHSLPGPADRPRPAALRRRQSASITRASSSPLARAGPPAPDT